MRRPGPRARSGRPWRNYCIVHPRTAVRARRGVAWRCEAGKVRWPQGSRARRAAPLCCCWVGCGGHCPAGPSGARLPWLCPWHGSTTAEAYQCRCIPRAINLLPRQRISPRPHLPLWPAACGWTAHEGNNRTKNGTPKITITKPSIFLFFEKEKYEHILNFFLKKTKKKIEIRKTKLKI